jgi:cell wall-associated NlpC family hydrolase
MLEELVSSTSERARALLNTPFKHAGREPVSEGLDWLGFIRVSTGNQNSPDLPKPYPTGSMIERLPTMLAGEPFLDLMKSWSNMKPILFTEAKTGDVICFRMQPGHPVFHAGIMTSPNKFAHVPEILAPRETLLVEWWKRRLAFAYQVINQ